MVVHLASVKHHCIRELSLLAFVVQIVMEVRKVPKKESDAMREALETVRHSVMNEYGIFASLVVSMEQHKRPTTGT